MNCPGGATATITLRYTDRRIVIGALLPERDPNLLDLCTRHAEGLTPPVGWVVDDARLAALFADRR
jgi:hypothetical protein